MKSKKEIEAVVIETIRNIQVMSGREQTQVGSNTVPIGGLEGFTSRNGLEATPSIAFKLNVNIPLDMNIFKNEKGNKALSVKEIADRIESLEWVEER